ncbi:phage tail tape measure protein [Kluyvera ascorbata]|uniref:phage tail tape measure protein n=1 Tax=Kluyvera ascorbata TaxID=51288 RepID=UPI0018A4CFF2|nr:phage tail tape measure protein [Kluyvera ascorbata]BCA39421.1 phage tail tape measure protein [Kluyvera ascorbata]
MSDQIASITLRADVADLKTASNELDKLGEAAAGAVGKADDLNSVFRAGAESTKQGTAGIKEQQTALKGLLENIDPVNKALNRLDEQQAALRNFQAKGFLDTDSFQAYSKILDDTRLKLTDTGEAAAKAQAELAATQAAEKQSAALKNLLGSIDPTIRAFNSLDEQHAQLVAHFESGRINSAQFEHFNTILNQTRERLSGVADVLPEALSRQEAAARRAGISVGQYSAAMRTLPAQFTDIATQLAGGQSPFLILLQQGGQIKDQFGSVKGALTGVGSYVMGLASPFTISAAAVALLTFAIYQNRKEIDEASKLTTSSLGASGDAAERLALNMVAISDKTGKTIDEVSKMFITTNDGASESIQKLIDVGYSYDEARKEVEKYKSTGNFTALNAEIDVHRREILKIGDAWSEAAIKEKNRYTGSNLGKQNVALGGGIDYGLKFIEQGIDLQKTMNQLTIDGNKAVAESVDWINKAWESTDRVAGAEARLKEAREQSRKIAFSGDKEAIANAQQLIALRQREVTDAIKQRDKKDNPKSPAVKVDADDRTIENYQTQSRTLTQTLETLRQTGDTQVKNTELSKQQSRFVELDEAAKTRALTAQEKSLLSSREAILNAAKVVDQKNKEVEAQQKINGLAQQANKYATQMSEKTAALRDSAGMSSRQRQRMMEEAQLRQGWLNGGGKLEDAGYAKELAALRNYYAEEDKLRGDWKAGAVSGWNEYLDAATNTYDAVKNVASSTLTGLSDMLTELMTTGTASVKEFGKSMLKMILEVTNRLMVAYAVQAAMGWISGGSSGGSTPGGAYANAAAGVTFNAKGGVYESSGLSKYVNGVYDSPQYFTFQGASKFAKGGVFGEAGPEAIMPLAKDSAGRLGVRAQGGGGAQPQVNIDIYVDNKGNTSSTTSGDGSDAARALGKEIEAKVTEVLVRAARSDGFLGKTFQPK